MSARRWAGSTVTAIGVAAASGAAQLGVGYGLGIVAWLPVQDQAGKIMWQASLAWVVWIAATSTAIGAIFANWLTSHGDPAEREGFALAAMRTTLALAAAVGALVAVPLVAVPSRAAESPQNFAPEWTAAGYVGVGVILGLAVAVAALNVGAIAANVVATVSYLWVLAVLAVIDGLRAGTEPLLAQLAIWKFSDGPMLRDFYVPGVLLMLAAAVVIGFLAAWRAGRRGDNRIGVAISGAVGPLLVAAAYLLAAPQFAGNTDVDVSQWSAHLFAPYAVIAGLAGSVLVAAIGPKESPEEKQERIARSERRRAERQAERAAAQEARRQAAEEAKRRSAEAKQTAAEAKQAAAESKQAKQRAAKDTDVTAGEAARADKPTKSAAPVSASSASGSVPAPGGKTAVEKPATAKPAPGKPLPAKAGAAGADLADDAYAPARAYRTRDGVDPDPKAYASDTGDTGAIPAPAKAEPPVPGRTDAPTPLWPSRTDDDGGSPPKGRRPKR